MNTLLDILQILDEVPNVPFFTNKISNALIALCRDLGLISNDTVVESDSLGLSFSIKRGKPKKRIILCSHLDHPGFVFNAQGKGRALGSVGGIGNLGLSKLTKPSNMDLYSKNGEFIGVSRVNIDGSNVICRDLKVENNTVGMWHIEDKKFTEPEIKMRSADNHVSTAIIALSVANVLSNLKDIEVVLLFTTIEEVHQISMIGICLRGYICGKRITSEDTFIILETMEMESYASGTPKYDLGPLIKVNDGGVPYGAMSNRNRNDAESMLLKASSTFNHQHCYSSGHTDAIALSLMTVCPNIATLAIPCVNKHNVTESGLITTENVRIEDIYSGMGILSKLLEFNELDEFANLLSTKALKEEKYVHKTKQDRVLKYKQNKSRMFLGFYYPENLRQWFNLVKSRIF